MEEQNKDTNQNLEEETVEEAAIDLPEPQHDSFTKFEMPSWYAMVLSLGLYACSAMLIMAVALIA